MSLMAVKLLLTTSFASRFGSRRRMVAMDHKAVTLMAAAAAFSSEVVSHLNAGTPRRVARRAEAVQTAIG